MFNVSAWADTAPKALGTFGAWQAYSYSEKDQPVCYMVQTLDFAQNAKNKKLRRGSARLSLTHRPAENSQDTISYTAGYNFKPISTVKITIGKNNFNLFTTRDTAWARDSHTDHAIAEAMLAGTTLLATGSPDRNGSMPITDGFSLKNAPSALHAIDKACGLDVRALPPSTRKTKTPPKHTDG
jgi:hypothetical protein